MDWPESTRVGDRVSLAPLSGRAAAKMAAAVR